MSRDYFENVLIQDIARNLLRDELGWQVEFSYNREIYGGNNALGC